MSDEPDGLAEMAEDAWSRGDITDQQFDEGWPDRADGWTSDYAPENHDDAYEERPPFASEECPAGGEHTWTDDAGEITARYGVHVYCDECGVTAPKPDPNEWRGP
jgi:hypothetical protein